MIYGVPSPKAKISFFAFRRNRMILQIAVAEILVVSDSSRSSCCTKLIVARKMRLPISNRKNFAVKLSLK